MFKVAKRFRELYNVPDKDSHLVNGAVESWSTAHRVMCDNIDRRIIAINNGLQPESDKQALREEVIQLCTFHHSLQQATLRIMLDIQDQVEGFIPQEEADEANTQ